MTLEARDQRLFVAVVGRDREAEGAQLVGQGLGVSEAHARTDRGSAGRQEDRPLQLGPGLAPGEDVLEVLASARRQGLLE